MCRCVAQLKQLTTPTPTVKRTITFQSMSYSNKYCMQYCDLHASEYFKTGNCYDHGQDGCCYQCYTGCTAYYCSDGSKAVFSDKENYYTVTSNLLWACVFVVIFSCLVKAGLIISKDMKKNQNNRTSEKPVDKFKK